MRMLRTLRRENMDFGKVVSGKSTALTGHMAGRIVVIPPPKPLVNRYTTAKENTVSMTKEASAAMTADIEKVKVEYRQSVETKENAMEPLVGKAVQALMDITGMAQREAMFELMRPSLDDIMPLFEIGLADGSLCINDCRAYLGMKPLVNKSVKA